MPIIPETLRAVRKKRGFSQQGLAERAAQIKGASVSKRTIARIESGEIAPEKVRAHTLESLAKALEVKSEELCKPPTEDSDAVLQELGYRRVSFLLGEDERLNFRWVKHHYDISAKDLIDAAPWMFTLLAEMSLADRERRLRDADASFEAALAQLPEHLGDRRLARSDFENAVSDENASLISRDVFGQRVLERSHEYGDGDPFDPDESNPFVDFVRRTAEKIGSDAIDPEHIELPYGGMPRWPVFKLWLDQLTGDDRWARFAIENIKGIVASLPDELKGEEKTAERIQWLIEQIPPEMKDQEEERLAKREAAYREIV